MTRDRGGVWNVDDERDDALPWLEPVDDETRRSGDSGRIIAMVLIGVGVLALVIVGVTLWRSWFSTGDATGDGSVIAAPQQPYKTRPENPGGMEVEGKGDSIYSTGQGSDPDGMIDLAAIPEAPVARGPSVEAGDVALADLPASTASGTPAAAKAPAAPKAPAASKPPVAAIAPPPAPAPTAPAPKPATAAAAAPAAAGGGTTLQLGAFSSSAKAEAAWKSLSGRYTYLADLTKQVSPVKSGDATLYRLRAAGASSSAAQSLCNRLKVAGEACTLVTP